MIVAENINKSFYDNHVLKDVFATFERGKANFIIGASGSGKTVFLKSLIGLHEVDTGSIHYDGRNFTKMNFTKRKNIRKEIGMLFQGSALFDSLTVEENVMFPLVMFTKKSYKERLKRANFCLDRVDLNKTNHLLPSELSGGMQKRVAIARAIALEPKYLFCDEPNSGLDPKTAIVIDNLIKEITVEYNTTTVINTHDMNSVLSMGDNIFFIYKGVIEWQGNNHEILKTDVENLNKFVFASEVMKRLI